VTLYGWDASDFDWPRGPMDLAAARADGIDFFTHKATESTNTQHVHYGEALNRARAAGIPFLGAYHVIRTGDIMAQVSYFLAYVTAQTPWWSSFGGWFFQADLEKWSYDPVAASMGPAFCAEVERRTGKRCILYAPKWAYGDSIGGSAPLWASAYGANPAGPYRNAYPGDASPSWGAYSGRTPAILQFGSQATIGRQPTCDINAFRGTVADFAQLIGGEQPVNQDDADLFVKTLLGWKMSPGGIPDPNVDFGHILVAARDYAKAANTFTPAELDAIATAVASKVPSASAIAAAIKADPPSGVTLTDAQIQQLAATIAQATAAPNFTVTLTGDAKPSMGA
jgi:GH25 family lysozyme M1 (1,4-beta-N-acetylmuramidase)